MKTTKISLISSLFLIMTAIGRSQVLQYNEFDTTPPGVLVDGGRLTNVTAVALSNGVVASFARSATNAALATNVVTGLKATNLMVYGASPAVLVANFQNDQLYDLSGNLAIDWSTQFGQGYRLAGQWYFDTIPTVLGVPITDGGNALITTNASGTGTAVSSNDVRSISLSLARVKQSTNDDLGRPFSTTYSALAGNNAFTGINSFATQGGTNTALLSNDRLYDTNSLLLAKNAVAKLLNNVTTSAQPVVMLGDSMSSGQNQNSASGALIGKMQDLYGNGGRADGNSWNLSVHSAVFSRPECSSWFTLNVAAEYTSDGSNYIQAAQGSWSASAIPVTAVGLLWEQQPKGGNFVMAVSSALGFYTNYYTLQGFSATTNIIGTNVPAYGSDVVISLSTLNGTNIFVQPSFITTNSGVQWIEQDKGGITLDDMLAQGTNCLAQMAAFYNPSLVLYHAKDFTEQSRDPYIMSNKIVQVMSAIKSGAPNCEIVLIGTPPVLGDSYVINNAALKWAALSHGYYFSDLWSAFPDFNTMTNSGLMLDGTHPNNAGAEVWSDWLFNDLGLCPSPKSLNAAKIAATQTGYTFISGTNYVFIGFTNGAFSIYINGNIVETITPPGRLVRIYDNAGSGRVAFDFQNGSGGNGGANWYNNPTINFWGNSTLVGIGTMTLTSTSDSMDFNPNNGSTPTHLSTSGFRLGAGAFTGNGSGLTNLITTSTNAFAYAVTLATNLITFTVPSGVTNTYEVGGWVNVTAVTVDVVNFQVLFTDENNAPQTIALDANITATGFNTVSTQGIRAKGGTTITIKGNLVTGTGSITYDIGGFVKPIL